MQNKAFWVGIQILVFVSFIYVVLGWVFALGICCGDDSYHAIIAKNLAHGLGYASTIQEIGGKYNITLFDPCVGVGPTIILPAAFVINLVGNKYWAPGVSIVSIWCTLLFFIGVLLHKFVQNKANLTIAIISFFLLSYIYTVYHVEQWYALLGEIPAAFLIILALLVFFDRDSKTNLFLTGIFFSLACYAKLIALIPFVSFILFIIIYWPDNVCNIELATFF